MYSFIDWYIHTILEVSNCIFVPGWLALFYFFIFIYFFTVSEELMSAPLALYFKWNNNKNTAL